VDSVVVGKRGHPLRAESWGAWSWGSS
jgi:hypothetical protein